MSDLDFDVLVIGAGIAGTSVAAHLAADRSVAVLEAESHPGFHSTGRSAALFSEMYGSAAVRALSRGSRAFLFDPPEGFAEAPLIKARGALYVARPDQIEALEAFRAQPDVAAVTQRIDTAGALDICPILRPDQVTGAIYEPDATDVDVHGLQQGYIRMLRQRGGQLLTDHPVTAMARADGKWVVSAGGRELRATTVVNAAGAWADIVGAMAGAAAIGLQPNRRTAILVDPPSGVSCDDWPLVIDIDEEFYFKPDAGLLLLSPADETPVEAGDAQPDDWDVAVAVDRVASATTLEVRRVKHRWAGLRSFVADRTPVAGYDLNAPDFFWLAGQGGYGIQTAPALSRLAACLVQGLPVPDDLAAHGVRAEDLAPSRPGLGI